MSDKFFRSGTICPEFWRADRAETRVALAWIPAHDQEPRAVRGII
jgi:hypothetical protein